MQQLDIDWQHQSQEWLLCHTLKLTQDKCVYYHIKVITEITSAMPHDEALFSSAIKIFVSEFNSDLWISYVNNMQLYQ